MKLILWCKVVLYLGIFVGTGALFRWIARERIIGEIVRHTQESVDGNVKRRSRETRQNLRLLEQKRGGWYRLDKLLIYSGMLRRFPKLTPEIVAAIWIVGAVVIYFAGALLTDSWWKGLLGALAFAVLCYMVLTGFARKNYNSVEANLMKFLDFLGNYSITAGEVTGIFNQISRYMEEPLKSVLDECYYEAQTSGDAGLALLMMAEKIEHPRFKELVRNLEISVRYSANFRILVQNSRRAIREHLRAEQERKTLMREGMVDMLILAVMSLFILMTVEQLIEASIWDILLHTLPGRISLGMIGTVFVLFYRKLR